VKLEDLPPLRDIVAAHDLGAKKSFGQHFLFDLNLTGKIARLAGPLEGRAVIEVGPGPGGLTRALLAAGAAKVIAVEKDHRFRPILEAISPRSRTVGWRSSTLTRWRSTSLRCSPSMRRG
jgi:16S rRNA (adenine1518-N6/adenine1519-N6)-dimethyltransferase